MKPLPVPLRQALLAVALVAAAAAWPMLTPVSAAEPMTETLVASAPNPASASNPSWDLPP